MAVHFRPYKDESDYMELRKVLTKKFADTNRRFYPSLGDFDYNRAFGGEKFFQNLTVCEVEDGTIVGAIWPGHYRILYCFTGPAYVHLGVQELGNMFVWCKSF